MVSTPILRVLLVEPADASAVGPHLTGHDPRFLVGRADSVEAAVAEVTANRYDCAVLDLLVVGIPDDLHAIRAADAAVAIVVLGDEEQDEQTVDALALGVEEHLTRGHMDAELAGRAIRFAVARRRAVATRVRQALQDPLTGLPNRLAIEEMVGEALQRAERRATRIALIFIDLDGFASIVDIEGRAVADEALVGVADRLGEVARESDAIGRLDTDTFVVVCEDLALEASVRRLAERIEEVLAEPIAAGGRLMHLRPVFTFASGGPSQTPAQLLRRSSMGTVDVAFGR